jgi:hypothetical protein
MFKPVRHDPVEAEMRSKSQQARPGSKEHCAICGRKFGLVRYYSWRTALCSTRCVDHFQTRREGDRKWLWRSSAADLKSLTHSRQNRLQGFQIESGTTTMDLLVPITFRSPRKDVAAM